jgi:hypothetical protein
LRRVAIEKTLNEQIVFQQATSATPTQFTECAFTQGGVAIQSVEKFIAHLAGLFA